MFRKFKISPFPIFLIGLLGCLDRYDPPSQSNLQLLVIDGFINVSDHSAQIKLTHSFPLNDNQVTPETEANVSVIDDEGSVTYLPEESEGFYKIRKTPFDISKKYQLHILTQSGKEYLSDQIEM